VAWRREFAGVAGGRGKPRPHRLTLLHAFPTTSASARRDGAYWRELRVCPRKKGRNKKRTRAGVPFVMATLIADASEANPRAPASLRDSG
jgi:hypothetical protein